MFHIFSSSWKVVLNYGSLFTVTLMSSGKYTSGTVGDDDVLHRKESGVTVINPLKTSVGDSF